MSRLTETYTAEVVPALIKHRLQHDHRAWVTQSS
jgi:hypothetical protein